MSRIGDVFILRRTMIERAAVGQVHETQKLNYNKTRRDRNKAVGACLNENKARTHGPATHGKLCGRCRTTHRKAVSL